MMKVIHKHTAICFLLMALVGLVGFGFYLSPETSYGISVDKSIYYVGEAILVGEDGGPTQVYNIDTGLIIDGQGDHGAGQDLSFSAGPGSYSIVEITEDGACEGNDLDYQECRDSAYFVDEVLITLIAQPGSGSSGGGANSNKTPEINILEPGQSVKNIKSKVMITYEAEDGDDHSGNSDSFGLGDKPVSIYYLSGKDPHTRILIKKDLPAVGSYTWDVTKVPEGNVYIVVEVVDKAGAAQQALSSELMVDNSAPIFKLTVKPETTKGEPVEITVEPSEELFGLPDLFVTQHGHEPIKVRVRSNNAGLFIGVYEPVPGFDGLAVIGVSGQDLNKNFGDIISSGTFFSVGVEPPPKPVITSPLDQELVASSTIEVVGGNARSDLKLSLIVNNKNTYNAVSAADGSFRFTKVALDKTFNKGVNFLRLVAKDPAGNQTEVALSVKFNLSPVVEFVSPIAGQALTGASSLQAAGSDQNGDILQYSFELAKASSMVFSNVAKNILTSVYSFDSTLLADGNYWARVVVDDGSAKATATSSVFTIRNYLPVISFTNGDKQIVNTKRTALVGQVKSTVVPTGDIKNPKLVTYQIIKVEYSLNDGATWQEVKTSGTGDFTIEFDTAEEKAYPVLVRAIDERKVYGRAQALVIADFGPPKAVVIESPANNAVFTNQDDQNKKLAGTQVTLTGKTEPGGTVVAVANGLEVGTTADAQGRFVLPDVSLTKHGANQIAVTVIDLAGNKSQVQTLTLQSNNQPTVRFIQPRAGRGLGGNTRIVWETRDEDLDQVKTTALKIKRTGANVFTTIADNPAGEEYVWPIPADMATGQYELVVMVTDGMSPGSALVPIAIDRTAPTVDSFKLNQTVVTKLASVRGQGIASDDLSGIEFAEYSLADDKWQTADIVSSFLANRAEFSVVHQAGLVDGEYEVKARVKDGSGNISLPVSAKLFVDTTAPRIGSFTFKRDNLSLLPNEAGEFLAAPDSSMTFVVSLEADAKTATATIGSLVLPLIRDQNNLWQAEVKLVEAGTQPISIEAVDELGHQGASQVVGQIKVMPSGKVWYSDDNQQSQPAGGSEIEVSVIDQSTGEKHLWQGESFGAANPIVANNQGQYNLTLPAGTYELRVSHPGFERLKTERFTLDRATLVNSDFKMVKRSGFTGWLKDLID